MPRREQYDPVIVTAIAARHQRRPEALLPVLHEVQAAFGYVPREAIATLADALNLTRAEVDGVVSFYHDFRRAPPRPHVLRVCRAEACQSVGGRQVWDAAERAAQNGDVQVEEVFCLGNCACAPSVQFDGRAIGRMNPDRVAALIAQLQEGLPA